MHANLRGYNATGRSSTASLPLEAGRWKQQADKPRPPHAPASSPVLCEVQALATQPGPFRSTALMGTPMREPLVQSLHAWPNIWWGALPWHGTRQQRVTGTVAQVSPLLLICLRHGLLLPDPTVRDRPCGDAQDQTTPTAPSDQRVASRLPTQ